MVLALAAAPAAAWTVSSYVDDRSERVVVAAAEAAQGFNRFGQRVVMTVTCRKRAFWADVHWGDQLGQDLARVAYHFAPQVGAQHALWPVGSDGESVRVQDVNGFVRSLVRSSTLMLRVSFPGGEQNVAVFELRGATRAVRRVLEACQGLPETD